MREFLLPRKKCRLRYHDLPGEKEPILFLHGLGCAGSLDYPQVASQPELAGHRRIIVDLLGSGFSDKPRDFDYQVRDHAAYLQEFVEELHLPALTVFGHSIGGAVAISLAALCPDRIKHLILGEANLDSGGRETVQAVMAYSQEDFLRRGFELLLRQSRMAGNYIWSASLSSSLPQAVYLLAQSATEGEKPSWREVLYSLSCSRTYIFGEYSLPDPDQELLPQQGIAVSIVAQAGHAMAVENPAGLAAAIASAL